MLWLSESKDLETSMIKWVERFGNIYEKCDCSKILSAFEMIWSSISANAEDVDFVLEKHVENYEEYYCVLKKKISGYTLIFQ